MTMIKLTTRINAPAETCFNLSRNIDVHQQSMAARHERAVAGVTSGLIGLNETVTWEARHLGIRWRMTVKLTEFKYPYFFADQMVQGPFRLMRHYHTFKPEGDTTVMIDEFVFRSPFGWLGKLADGLFLKFYMRNLLLRRNATLRQLAEAGTPTPVDGRTPR